MRDPAENGPVVLFDGVCNLCHAAVRFIIRNDPEAVFRFASLDSAAGRRRLAAVAAEAEGAGAEDGSVVLIEDGRAWRRSEAALRVATRLGLPWRMAAALRVLPSAVRDGVYDFVARRRYRWFGRKDRCPAPDAALRDRFLD